LSPLWSSRPVCEEHLHSLLGMCSSISSIHVSHREHHAWYTSQAPNTSSQSLLLSAIKKIKSGRSLVATHFNSPIIPIPLYVFNSKSSRTAGSELPLILSPLSLPPLVMLLSFIPCSSILLSSYLLLTTGLAAWSLDHLVGSRKWCYSVEDLR
jgi:hypothetical protein